GRHTGGGRQNTSHSIFGSYSDYSTHAGRPPLCNGIRRTFMTLARPRLSSCTDWMTIRAQLCPATRSRQPDAIMALTVPERPHIQHTQSHVIVSGECV